MSKSNGSKRVAIPLERYAWLLQAARDRNSLWWEARLVALTISHNHEIRGGCGACRFETLLERVRENILSE